MNAARAAEILGKDASTLARWLKPGSGAHTPWGGFGPEQTFMIPAAVVVGPEAAVKVSRPTGGLAWVEEDVERFGAEILGASGGRKPKAPDAVKSS